jgi:hypothetical protein
VTLVFGRRPSEVFGSSLVSSGTYCPCTDVVSSGDDGGCRQERRRVCVWTWLRPAATGLSLSTAGTVTVQDIKRELTSSFGAKLP